MAATDLPELEVLLQKIKALLAAILTAQDGHGDRAAGLESEDGNSVVQSFNEEELVALIQALLRRASSTTTPPLEWGGLQLHPNGYEVMYHATPIALTPKEYELLELFLRNSRRVYSCSNILEHLWERQDTPSEEAVRTHIKGLRRKLKAAGAPSDFVETVYGFGYRLKPLSAQDDLQTPSQDLQTVPLLLNQSQ
jgi:DNA-binding response OmpR family regulator